MVRMELHARRRRISNIYISKIEHSSTQKNKNFLLVAPRVTQLVVVVWMWCLRCALLVRLVLIDDVLCFSFEIPLDFRQAWSLFVS